MPASHRDHGAIDEDTVLIQIVRRRVAHRAEQKVDIAIAQAPGKLGETAFDHRNLRAGPLARERHDRPGEPLRAGQRHGADHDTAARSPEPVRNFFEAVAQFRHGQPEIAGAPPALAGEREVAAPAFHQGLAKRYRQVPRSAVERGRRQARDLRSPCVAACAGEGEEGIDLRCGDTRRSDQIQRPLGSLGKQQRRRRGPHPGWFSLEKLASDLFFQPGDGLRQGWLGQRDGVRGRSHAPAAHGCRECSEAPDVGGMLLHPVPAIKNLCNSKRPCRVGRR